MPELVEEINPMSFIDNSDIDIKDYLINVL